VPCPKIQVFTKENNFIDIYRKKLRKLKVKNVHKQLKTCQNNLNILSSVENEKNKHMMEILSFYGNFFLELRQKSKYAQNFHFPIGHRKK